MADRIMFLWTTITLSYVVARPHKRLVVPRNNNNAIVTSIMTDVGNCRENETSPCACRRTAFASRQCGKNSTVVYTGQSPRKTGPPQTKPVALSVSRVRTWPSFDGATGRPSRRYIKILLCRARVCPAFYDLLPY